MKRLSPRLVAAVCLVVVAASAGAASAAAPAPPPAAAGSGGSLASLLGFSGAGAGAGMAADETAAPYLEIDGRPATAAELPLVGTFADVDVAGTVAHVTVTQHYQNRFLDPIEAVYVFPASTRAAVTGMRIIVGDRVVEARVKEKEAARAEYDDAKATGHTAGLLESSRPNVFKMSVANILPGESVVVELDYVERLQIVDGAVELVVPASVAERYQVGPKPDGTWPSLEEAPPEPRSTRRVAPRLPLGYPWRVIRGLSVTVAAPVPIVTPTSPSHRVHPAADADGSFTFEHVETDELPRDFVLHWRLGGDGLSTGALVYDAPDGERFFLATVAPPAQVADEEPVLPRDYVFVVDVSGSMRGWPLDKARRLMKRLVSDLRPSDRFNVVTFAGAAEVLSPTALAPTAANVARACDDLDALAAGGGTELVAALRTALALPTSEGLVRTVVLVTDGFIDAERDAFELIRAHRGEMNLFAFGVGDSPNRFLLEGVARAGGGEPFVVASEADPDDVGARFRAVARAPLLTDVTVDFEGVDAYDVVPASEQLPTVYASRPLLVIGKLRAGDQAGLVRFRGRAASEPWEAVVDLADARRGPELEALRTLWARERVAELSDGGGSGDDAARREAIVTIGLHYGLLTEHTSFVAVDPRVRTAPGAPGTVVVPQPIPGVSVGQSGGGGMILGVMSGSGGGAFGGGTGVGGGGGGISGVVGSSGPIGPIGSGQGFGKIDNGGGASVAPAVSVTIVRLTVVGGLGETVARRVLMMKRAMMAHVYRRILYKRPDVRGKVAVELTIAPTGRVTRAKVVPGASADAELASDVARMLNRIAFPKADQGTVVTVVYVFGPPRR